MVECELRIDTGIEKPVVCFSDCHMGGGGNADDWDEVAFGHFWDSIPIDWTIVSVGDFCENWQFTRRELHRFRADWFRRLKERNVIFVPGNHDYAEYRRLPASLRLGNVLIEHGHQADILNWQLSGIGHAATWLAGVCERCGWQVDSLDWETAGIRKLTENAGHLAASDRKYIAYGAGRLDEEAGAVACVLGHTHRRCLLRDVTDRVVGNSGSWVKEPPERSAVVLLPDRIRLVREAVT